LPDRRRHLGGRGGAHPELQTKHGIFNHENLIFDDLIADRKYQSVFIFTPAPIKGATGSNGCPIAIIDPTSMTWSSAAVMSAAASIICGDLADHSRAMHDKSWTRSTWVQRPLAFSGSKQ